MANDKNLKILTPEEWEQIVDKLDCLFPKGECKERGKALVLVPEILLILDYRLKK